MNASRIYSFRHSYFGSIISYFAGLVLLSSAAAAAPTVTLINPTARLDYGHTDGRATMVLRVDGLDTKQLQDQGLLKKEDLHDFGSTPLQKLDIDINESVPPGAGARTWIIRMEIARSETLSRKSPGWTQNLYSRVAEVIRLGRFGWLIALEILPEGCRGRVQRDASR